MIHYFWIFLLAVGILTLDDIASGEGPTGNLAWLIRQIGQRRQGPFPPWMVPAPTGARAAQASGAPVSPQPAEQSTWGPLAAPGADSSGRSTGSARAAAGEPDDGLAPATPRPETKPVNALAPGAVAPRPAVPVGPTQTPALARYENLQQQGAPKPAGGVKGFLEKLAGTFFPPVRAITERPQFEYRQELGQAENAAEEERAQGTAAQKGALNQAQILEAGNRAAEAASQASGEKIQYNADTGTLEHLGEKPGKGATKNWKVVLSQDGTPWYVQPPQGDPILPDEASGQFPRGTPSFVGAMWTAAQAHAKQTREFGAVPPEISAQLGEMPKAGQKNSRGLTAEQWGKEAERIKSNEQAQRYVGLAQTREYGVIDRDTGQLVMLDAATINAAPKGKYMPASGGAQAMSRQAIFQDMNFNASNVDQAIANLKTPFTAPQRAQFALILRDPDVRSAVSQFVNSTAAQGLAPDQIDYLTAVASLAENAMALRTVAGMGQSSDELRAAILRTIPGPNTPSSEYAQRQMKLFHGVLDRLARGVPGVGSAVQPNQPGGGGQVSVRDPQGGIHYFSSQADADKFRKLAGLK
jgi:hypothetical protein